MPAWLPFGPADIFADQLDALIKRQGGSGNIGQIILRCDGPLDQAALRQRWQQAHVDCPLLSARVGRRRLLPGFIVPTTSGAAPAIETGTHIDALASQVLNSGLDPRNGPGTRFSIAEDGIALTWHHSLGDAEGARRLLRWLGGTDTTAFDPDWRNPNRRWTVPRDGRSRGELARNMPPLLKSLRQRHIATLPGARGNRNAALVRRAHWQASPEQSKTWKKRQKAQAGRFAETAFVLGHFAHVLQQHIGDHSAHDHQLLFPLAVDERGKNDACAIANPQAFMFLACPQQASLSDSISALKHSHKEWLAAQGPQGLASALSFFPLLPKKLVRKELGWGRAGLAATACCGNAGEDNFSAEFAGATITAIEHAVAMPASPGLTLLIHKWNGRPALGLLVCGNLTKTFAVQTLLDALVDSLLTKEVNDGQ